MAGKNKGLCAHSACYVEEDKSMIVFGGYDGNVPYSNKTIIFHTKGNYFDNFETFGQLPEPRIRHSSVILQNKMYIFGGFIQNSERSNDLHILNLKTKTWTKVESTGTVPSPRSSHICLPTLDGANFLIFDGKHHSNRNEIFEYDTKNNNWSEKQIIGKFEKKSNLTACWHEDTIYIFGGRYYDDRFNTVESIKFGKALRNAMNLHLINLLSAEILTDLEITIEKKVFKCHSCIISQSSYFKNLCQKKSEFSIEGIHVDTFNLMLKYLYGSFLPNQMDEFMLIQLYSSAVRFEIHPLTREILEHINNCLSKDNVLVLLKASNKSHCQTIKTICFQYFSKFKEDIIKQPGMKQLGEDLLFELLSYNENVISLLEDSNAIETKSQIIFENHLSYLHESKDFFDIMLVSEENIPIKAHKAVLFLSSQYFQCLFRGNTFKDSNDKQLTFQVSHKALLAAVQFMYRCSCDLPKKIDDLLELVQFADFLILSGLKEIALGQLLFEITPDNAFEVLENAINSNIGHIVQDLCWKSLQASNKAVLLENLMRLKYDAACEVMLAKKELNDINEKLKDIDKKLVRNVDHSVHSLSEDIHGKLSDFDRTLEMKVNESIKQLGNAIDEKIEKNFNGIKEASQEILIQNRQYYEKQMKEQKLIFQTELLEQKNQFQQSLKSQQVVYEKLLNDQQKQMNEFLMALRRDDSGDEKAPKKRKLVRPSSQPSENKEE